jgi:hypothetical protein
MDPGSQKFSSPGEERPHLPADVNTPRADIWTETLARRRETSGPNIGDKEPDTIVIEACPLK